MIYEAIRDAVIRVQNEPIPPSHLYLKDDVLMWIAEADRILACLESEPRFDGVGQESSTSMHP